MIKNIPFIYLLNIKIYHLLLSTLDEIFKKFNISFRLCSM